MEVNLRRVVEKSGREFVVGAELSGCHGVVVKSAVRIGNYVTIKFGRARVADVPKPITVHVDDVLSSEEAADA